MATLTVKGIPDDLVARLKREATRNRRSLNGEVIHRLENSAGQPGRDAQAILRELDQNRIRIQGPLPTPEDVRKAIEEGRE